MMYPWMMIIIHCGIRKHRRNELWVPITWDAHICILCHESGNTTRSSAALVRAVFGNVAWLSTFKAQTIISASLNRFTPLPDWETVLSTAKATAGRSPPLSDFALLKQVVHQPTLINLMLGVIIEGSAKAFPPILLA